MTILILMGVSGCGKSTLAAALAETLHWPFQEGDDLHPPTNRAKMAAGIPLTDDDRAPWLARINDWIIDRINAGENGIVTCSALKKSYRQRLGHPSPATRLVYLQGPPALLQQRLASRAGHFFNPALLDTQLATLEPPGPDEAPLIVNIAHPPALQRQQILDALAES